MDLFEIYMILDHQQNTTEMYQFVQELWPLIDLNVDFFGIYMAHDKQQNRVQKGHEYLSLVYDVVVLFMFSLIADWTRVV